MPSTADAAGTAETAERTDAADPTETATDDAADDWYASRWGRIFYWTVLAAAVPAVGVVDSDALAGALATANRPGSRSRRPPISWMLTLMPTMRHSKPPTVRRSKRCIPTPPRATKRRLNRYKTPTRGLNRNLNWSVESSPELVN